MDNKIIITPEMVKSFAEMIKGGNNDDINLALDVLDNRDKSNYESETNFLEISHEITNNDIIFPKDRKFVLRVNNEILFLNREGIFSDEKDAKASLSRHLTYLIGTSNMSWQDKEKMKEAKKNNPNFNKAQYIQNYRRAQSKNLPYASKNSPHQSYFTAIKVFFGGGKELRDFLISNHIIKIEKL